MTEPALVFDRVSLGYSYQPVVEDLSVSIQSGSFVGVIGPNGSGKSTLLKGILGILRPISGQITVLGNSGPDVIKSRSSLGYVPQHSGIDRRFPATVKEAVLMGLYGRIGLFKRPGARDHARAMEVLDEVGLADIASNSIGRLSGGQLQRVLIARALVSRPSMLLLDEPTSAVDLHAEQGILSLLASIGKERQISVIMVTHNVGEIVEMADELLLLNGRMEAYGPPDKVLSAETVAKVFGGYGVV